MHNPNHTIQKSVSDKTSEQSIQHQHMFIKKMKSVNAIDLSMYQIIIHIMTTNIFGKN